MPPRTRGGPSKRPAENRIEGRKVTASSRRGDLNPPQSEGVSPIFKPPTFVFPPPPSVVREASPVTFDFDVETPVQTGQSPITREDEILEDEAGNDFVNDIGGNAGSIGMMCTPSSSELHGSHFASPSMIHGRGKGTFTSYRSLNRHESVPSVDDNLNMNVGSGSRTKIMERGRGRGGYSDGGGGGGVGGSGGGGGGGDGDGDGDGDNSDYEDSDGNGNSNGDDEDEESWVLSGSFGGGPRNPEILYGFLGHIASAIWHHQERTVLKCRSPAEQRGSWPMHDHIVSCYVTASGLSHLSDCMFENLDSPLLSAFVERWQPETNSFHLPFGEMTITLHDVHHILQIPVAGKAFIADKKRLTMRTLIGKTLHMSAAEIKTELVSSGIKFPKFRDFYIQSNVSHGDRAIGYLWWLLGVTLFTDKTCNRVNVWTLPYLTPIEDSPSVAWGAAALAYLYRQLGIASRIDCKQLAGCLTLLQAWIYEYFPTLSSTRRTTWKHGDPCAQRWSTHYVKRNNPQALQEYRKQLDNMTEKMVNWTPFGKNPAKDSRISLFRGIIHCRAITEPYMPDRCLRQFGYMQSIPMPLLLPNVVHRSRNVKKYRCKHAPQFQNFTCWERYVIRDIHRATATSSNYLSWFRQRSHVRVMPTTKGDDGDSFDDDDFDDVDVGDADADDDHATYHDEACTRCLDILPFIRQLQADTEGEGPFRPKQQQRTIKNIVSRFKDLL